MNEITYLRWREKAEIDALTEQMNRMLHRLYTSRVYVSAQVKLHYYNQLKQRYIVTKNAIVRQFATKIMEFEQQLLSLKLPPCDVLPIQIEENNSIAPPKKKYACLVGINYEGTSDSLRGCVNDVHDIESLLVNRFQYESSNIVKLTDSMATRDNILKAFTMLLKNSEQGSNLFFSFSGHGYYTKHLCRSDDTTDNETDGNDEIIICNDNSYIIDDEFRSLLQTHLKKDTSLFAIFDNCHSGTVLDLPYEYSALSVEQTGKKSMMSQVILVSGCCDDQVSMDALLDGKYSGALTHFFVKLFQDQNGSITYDEMMQLLTKNLKTNGFTQKPCLSSGIEIRPHCDFVHF